MSGYEPILVAVDLSDTSKAIVLRAHQIARALNCKLSMMQSLENFPVDMPVDLPVELVPPEGADKTAWFKEYAYNSLKDIADSLDINNPDIHLTIGTAKEEILQFAKQNQVDLIVVGFYERHGLSLLLKSTTDGIVHSSTCDVLAMHC